MPKIYSLYSEAPYSAQIVAGAEQQAGLLSEGELVHAVIRGVCSNWAEP